MNAIFLLNVALCGNRLVRQRGINICFTMQLHLSSIFDIEFPIARSNSMLYIEFSLEIEILPS